MELSFVCALQYQCNLVSSTENNGLRMVFGHSQPLYQSIYWQTRLLITSETSSPSLSSLLQTKPPREDPGDMVMQ